MIFLEENPIGDVPRGRVQVALRRALGGSQEHDVGHGARENDRIAIRGSFGFDARMYSLQRGMKERKIAVDGTNVFANAAIPKPNQKGRSA